MDRLDLILEYLKQHNLVTVEELVQALSVSAATIRRDLIKLDETGVIFSHTWRCNPQSFHSCSAHYIGKKPA